MNDGKNSLLIASWKTCGSSHGIGTAELLQSGRASLLGLPFGVRVFLITCIFQLLTTFMSATRVFRRTSGIRAVGSSDLAQVRSRFGILDVLEGATNNL